jgi:PEGA domain-containing protein
MLLVMRARILLGLLLACGHTTTPAPTPIPDTKATPPPATPDAAVATAKIGVALTVTPPDADVTIGDVSYGKASELAPVVELKPGLYTLVVQRAGFSPYRAEFTVADKVESFVVRLDATKR